MNTKTNQKLRNIVYRNEAQWKTKKAKKAHLSIIYAILFMLAVQTVVTAFNPKTLIVENKRWDIGIEAESAKALPEHKDEVKDHTSVGGLEQMIAEKFPEDPQTAIAIAKAESGLRPDAVGDGHITFQKEGKSMGMSCGIFQVRVLPGRPDCETLKDVEKNLDYARKIYDSRGWTAWSVFTNQSYLKFL